MPSQTFYRLPPDKKETILTAARKEFSRVTFDQASINKIIEDAGISRGSFYMYFQDKRDLLYQLLDGYIAEVIACVESGITEKNGDPFFVFTIFFDATVTHFSGNKENRLFFRNVFSGMHSLGEQGVFGQINMQDLMEHKNRKKDWDTILGKIDKSCLKVSSKADIEELFFLLFVITKRAVLHVFFQPDSVEKIRKRLLSNFEMIKYGVADRRFK